MNVDKVDSSKDAIFGIHPKMSHSKMFFLTVNFCVKNPINFVHCKAVANLKFQNILIVYAFRFSVSRIFSLLGVLYFMFKNILSVKF